MVTKIETPELTSGLEDLNDPATTAAYYQVPVQTLATWRSERKGPAYVRIGRLIRYRREDILRFVSENLQGVA